MKRKTVRTKEFVRELESAGILFEISKKDLVEVAEDKEQGFKGVFVNRQLRFLYLDGTLVPSLRLLQENSRLLKQVVVDTGAIRFVVGGADIMRPGIVEIDEAIALGESVVVIDQVHKKPLAICKALFPGTEMNSMSSGKVLKNLHYVGDSLWEMG